MSQTPTAGLRLAQASLQFIGCPYKFQGRDPALGLDCVGLVMASLKAINRPAIAPTGYRLRNASITPFITFAATNGLIKALGVTLPGDIVMAVPGPGQSHLLIASPAVGYVHAHAGQGRIVHMPGKLPWKTLEAWRIAAE